MSDFLDIFIHTYMYKRIETDFPSEMWRKSPVKLSVMILNEIDFIKKKEKRKDGK